MFKRLPLFLRQILTNIESNGCDDDHAFNDELPVRIDTDIGQAIVDDTEDQNTGHNARHRTDSAGCRDSADHAGRDRIKLVHIPVAIRCAAGTSRFQYTCKSVQSACNGVDVDQVAADSDT